MRSPLMPKATAVWLVENTSLTFDQIADFCGLHPLEVQAIADGEVATQMLGLDPVANGQTTAAELERCQADPEARLKLLETAIPSRVRSFSGAGLRLTGRSSSSIIFLRPSHAAFIGRRAPLYRYHDIGACAAPPR